MVILLQPAALPKPALGQTCNGCGVCCAWQPCPLGVLVSRRRHGACDALQWQAEQLRYRCAMVADPRSVWPALPPWTARLLQRLARRWIAAGVGCDADIDVQAPP